jgi:hypothetical protein
MNIPQIYKVGSDEMGDVTQEWCDGAQNALNKLALQRNLIRKISNLNVADKEDVSKLDKIHDIFITVSKEPLKLKE